MKEESALLADNRGEMFRTSEDDHENAISC